MQNAGLDADIQSILLTANPDRAGPEGPQKLQEGWSTTALKEGWECWGCSV